MDAYAQLVRAYQPTAVRLAHVLCGGTADAEDAAQEAFIKAYRALDRHRDGAPFRPWLLAIVANEARNRRRAAGRRAHYELTMVEDRATGEAVPSAEAAVLTRAARDTLLGAVASLPTRQRDVVACRYLLGLTELETAVVLGIAAGTVKSRSSRGLGRLREVVDDD